MSMTYENYLEHYGVKGMKWGVRKDEAVLTRISRSKNTTYDPTISKADRKADRKEGKAAYKEYKKNTNRKERKQDRKQATAERGQNILEESLKNPTGFVSTRMMMPNGTMHQSTMTGRLLVEQLSKGRVVDMRNTQLTMLEVRKK